VLDQSQEAQIYHESRLVSLLVWFLANGLLVSSVEGMQEQPSVALQRLIAALERHLEVCATKRDGSQESIQRAFDMVEDAFLSYEEALADSYDEYLPIALAEDE